MEAGSDPDQKFFMHQLTKILMMSSFNHTYILLNRKDLWYIKKTNLERSRNYMLNFSQRKKNLSEKNCVLKLLFLKLSLSQCIFCILYTL